MFMYQNKNKYHNKKVIIDGHKFDSILEAQRYTELKLMQKQGIIKDLELQKPYELIPSFKKNNKTFKKASYIADFVYYDNELGKVIVEDTKGYITDIYALKKKMFEYLYKDLTIREIKRR